MWVSPIGGFSGQLPFAFDSINAEADAHFDTHQLWWSQILLHMFMFLMPNQELCMVGGDICLLKSACKGETIWIIILWTREGGGSGKLSEDWVDKQAGIREVDLFQCRTRASQQLRHTSWSEHLRPCSEVLGLAILPSGSGLHVSFSRSAWL